MKLLTVKVTFVLPAFIADDKDDNDGCGHGGDEQNEDGRHGADVGAGAALVRRVGPPGARLRDRNRTVRT